MNNNVKRFLEAKRYEEKKKHEEEKRKTLNELGLYEKVYSPDNKYSEEFSLYDYNAESYYKIVYFEITDEEFEEVKKYSRNGISGRVWNPISNVLLTIAILIYIAGFILGIIMGNVSAEYSREFSWEVACIYWEVAFLSGTAYLGFSEIIQLLNDIKNK